MKGWLAILILTSCRDGEPTAAVPGKPATTPASAPVADRLLEEARVRASETMGVEVLQIAGLRADGTLDPEDARLTIEWQERKHGDVEVLSADVPCVKLTWSPATGWVRDPGSTCRALGRPGVGYAALGLPRCTVVQVLDRMRSGGTPIASGSVTLRYGPTMAHASGDTIAPGPGRWELASEQPGGAHTFARDDDCDPAP